MRIVGYNIVEPLDPEEPTKKYLSLVEASVINQADDQTLIVYADYQGEKIKNIYHFADSATLEVLLRETATTGCLDFRALTIETKRTESKTLADFFNDINHFDVTGTLEAAPLQHR